VNLDRRRRPAAAFRRVCRRSSGEDSDAERNAWVDLMLLRGHKVRVLSTAVTIAVTMIQARYMGKRVVERQIGSSLNR